MFIQLSRIFHEIIWLSYWLIYKINLQCYKFLLLIYFSFQYYFKVFKINLKQI